MNGGEGMPLSYLPAKTMGKCGFRGCYSPNLCGQMAPSINILLHEALDEWRLENADRRTSFAACRQRITLLAALRPLQSFPLPAISLPHGFVDVI